MEKILILGATGMLGKSLYKHLKNEYCVRGVAHKGTDYCFDLSCDDALIQCIDSFKPDILVNCAAYVSINGCEADVKRAYVINARLPIILSEVCRKRNIYFVHISTDHFYLNDGNMRHNESEKVVLVNEYARTKYLGEQLLQCYKTALVVRTNFIGLTEAAGMKESFLNWLIDNYKAGKRIPLYNDYFTSGIYVDELSELLDIIIQKKCNGILNVASCDVYTKEEFACSFISALYGKLPVYDSISVKFSGGAKRANSLGLDTSRASSILGVKMPTLESSINRIISEVRRKYE